MPILRAGLRADIFTITISTEVPAKALSAISFELKKGESLGIIGRTGSGKSTIANLLCRLYDPTDGEVFIDGTDLKLVNLSAYRQCIGYVPQEVFLFSDSIKNNIAFGLKEELITDLKKFTKQRSKP